MTILIIESDDIKYLNLVLSQSTGFIEAESSNIGGLCCILGVVAHYSLPSKPRQ
jgi:hypothetical protein